MKEPEYKTTHGWVASARSGPRTFNTVVRRHKVKLNRMHSNGMNIMLGVLLLAGACGFFGLSHQDVIQVSPGNITRSGYGLQPPPRAVTEGDRVGYKVLGTICLLGGVGCFASVRRGNW